MSRKLLLIVNPRSGTMRGQKQLLQVIQILCEADFEVTVHTTRFPKDATEVVRERAGGFDVICALGGDGTLNEVVTGAISSGYAGAIGFLPCGTTNDLANTLGLPKNLPDSARLIAEGTAPYLDFGAFNDDRYFSYIASFGAFTEVSYSTGQKAKNTFGHLAYVANGVGAAFQIKPYHVRVECDGKLIEGEFVFGAAANSFSIGGMVKLQKDVVDLSDGLHELALVKNPKSVSAFINILHEIARGKFSGENVLFLKGKDIVFQTDETVPWCVDGEYAGDHKEVHIRNLHEKVRIFRP